MRFFKTNCFLRIYYTKKGTSMVYRYSVNNRNSYFQVKGILKNRNKRDKNNRSNNNINDDNNKNN